MIFVIDSDRVMARCIRRAIGGEAVIIPNAIEAMRRIADGEMPRLILMDIMIDGPDGFTLLNELISYNDTAEIPIVIVTALDLTKRSLKTYGVVEVLDKDVMVPEDIRRCVREYARD